MEENLLWLDDLNFIQYPWMCSSETSRRAGPTYGFNQAAWNTLCMVQMSCILSFILTSLILMIMGNKPKLLKESFGQRFYLMMRI